MLTPLYSTSWSIPTRTTSRKPSTLRQSRSNSPSPKRRRTRRAGPRRVSSWSTSISSRTTFGIEDPGYFPTSQARFQSRRKIYIYRGIIQKKPLIDLNSAKDAFAVYMLPNSKSPFVLLFRSLLRSLSPLFLFPGSSSALLFVGIARVC